MIGKKPIGSTFSKTKRKKFDYPNFPYILKEIKKLTSNYMNKRSLYINAAEFYIYYTKFIEFDLKD